MELLQGAPGTGNQGMKLSIVAATMLALAGTAATATPVYLRLSGDATAQFIVDSSPVPDSLTGDYFALFNRSGTINGAAVVADLYFYGAGIGGGVDLNTPLDLISLGGAVLFTGPNATPAFTLGKYSLTNYPAGDGSYTLQIAAVPEPASWALMLAGFAASGASFRRARRRTSVA